MNVAAWLHDPERVLLGTSQAIERVRARGAESIEPDDLMAGMLLAVSRFGIVDLGERVIDLTSLDLRFDMPSAVVEVKPRYTDAAVAVFEQAARVARADGGARLAPIHLLVALGEHSVLTFSKIAVRYGVDPTGWRRLLAAIRPPRTSRAALKPVVIPSGHLPRPESAGLLTPDEAAGLLGVQIQTLRTLIRVGKVPAFRVAGERAIRIRREDLGALLAHQNVPLKPTGAAPALSAVRPAGEALE